MGYGCLIQQLKAGTYIDTLLQVLCNHAIFQAAQHPILARKPLTC